MYATLPSVCCVIVTVTSVTHPVDGSVGAYFWFEADEWTAMVGASSATEWHDTIYDVYQYRNGVLIWQGLVVVWATAGNGVHGRRHPSGVESAGNWEIGDQIQLPPGTAQLLSTFCLSPFLYLSSMALTAFLTLLCLNDCQMRHHMGAHLT